MDKGYEKEQFTTISFKCSTAKKFRSFTKKMGASNSMTLLLMIEFFESNGISPKESIGPQMQTLESLIKKRINGVIAIMKDIEKNQTKPTVAMMQSLFQEAEPKKKLLLLEKEHKKEKKPRFKAK
ncbi:MAG: BfmA/BtgA family mobilization protein [Algibacter sp.]|uniref:BfmA/BtgA family mobilization protein n=1 Tax=Algibacter sp. TaxID=1872428 RepID=UPI00260BAFF3|nr:BfmA/BtgA family mobilization protein [Algibacter sp.]MDG1729910.1 BfmA/BtgA family mobilization protein [Algibacter sp.]MDG2178501.1 BfmA/BtgA family mobilization protein [Algibacter sp.]